MLSPDLIANIITTIHTHTYTISVDTQLRQYFPDRFLRFVAPEFVRRVDVWVVGWLLGEVRGNPSALLTE